MSDAFDKFVGAYDELPGVHKTRPATITDVQPMLGNAQSYIVQTYKTESGEYVTFQMIHAEGSLRVIIPPKVAMTILRQHEAVVKMARRYAGKRRWSDMPEDEREARVVKLRAGKGK